ncbi:MAG: kelch repeat-containing protein [Myxococcota bacterium]|nr:kelch repeat-containing protein [Myxococcota bacterium]
MGLLMLMLGCGEGADYNLQLVPIVPENQLPFDGLTRIDLVVEHADGSEEAYTLDELSGSPALGEMGALEGGTIAVKGYSGTALSAFGRSQPITLQTGKLEAPVLVASTEQVGWFPTMDTPLVGGAVVAIDGVFWVFGGDTKRMDYGVAGSTEGSNLVRAIDLTGPDALTLTAQDYTMPDNGTGTDTWAGSTATLLQDGRVLIAGGGPSLDYMENDALAQAVLFDPSTGTFSELLDLEEARVDHQAVPFHNGDVALISGISASNAIRQIEIYRAADDSIEPAAQLGTFNPSAAPLGLEGILICGGMDLGDEAFTDECFILDFSGNLSDAAPLPAPRGALQLTQLTDGLVLATGGASVNGEAETDAWLYDVAEDAWTEAGPLNIARARHKTVPLPDGSALVIGGAAELQPNTLPVPGGDQISCVERFDPTDQSFAVLDGCTASDSSGGTPNAVINPSVASDLRYGVLIIGGAESERLAAVDDLSFFPAVPGE